jgi:hypothetical protein
MDAAKRFDRGQPSVGPMVMLADLGNALDMSQQNEGDKAERVVSNSPLPPSVHLASCRQGTQGFISREIGNANEIFPLFKANHCPPPHTLRQEICSRLRSVPNASTKAVMDALQDSSDVVERLDTVIGEREETYIQVINTRCEWEENLYKEDPEIAPMSTMFRIAAHVPQHDAESIFWLLWFLLARANPVSPVREANEDEMDAYREYCLAMFTPQSDFNVDQDSRLILMFNRNTFYDSLDPSLSHL